MRHETDSRTRLGLAELRLSRSREDSASEEPMTLRKRVILWVAGVLAALILLVGITAVYVLQSPWFYDKVRQAIIDTVEKATGGRVEIASFRFDWKQLRAEVRDFVLHGTEPPDKPPLLRAGSVVVTLKLVSILRKDVDIQSLTVSDPRVYLIIGSDGRTNFPEPKVRRTGKNTTVEDILKLAIGRFSLERGTLRSGGAEPHSVHRARRESERPPGV